MQYLLGRLLRVIESQEEDWNETADIKPVRGTLVEHRDTTLTVLELTVLHSMVESGKDSNYWDAYTLAQALLGIWFAASHQPWVVYDSLPSSLIVLTHVLRCLRTYTSSSSSFAHGKSMSSSSVRNYHPKHLLTGALLISCLYLMHSSKNAFV